MADRPTVTKRSSTLLRKSSANKALLARKFEAVFFYTPWNSNLVTIINLATSDAPMGWRDFSFCRESRRASRLAHDSAIEARRARLQRPYPAPTDSIPPSRACLPSFGARATYGEDLILR